MQRLEFEMFANEILSRLPTKCVGRLRCVSRQWRYELSSKLFAIIHYHRTAKYEDPKVITLTNSSIDLLNLINGNVDISSKKTISFPVDTCLSNLTILASEYGLLLISVHWLPNELILWNPTTNKFKNLCDKKPKHFFDFKTDAVGIYIDSSNDVKILLLQRRMDHIVPRVYSRKTCEWKTLTFMKDPDLGSLFLYWLSSGAFCNKVLYFPSAHYWTPAKSYTIAFDVESETFSKFPIPQSTNVIGRQRSFLKLRNTLHMFIVLETPETIVKLYKFQDDLWSEVLSFSNVKLFFSYEAWRNNLDENKGDTWSVEIDRCGIMDIQIGMKESQYLGDVVTYKGLHNVASFEETVVSPI
ncbi:F-box/kelch-repeat protein At3g23880-like [Helianthus annuus]|uniref:F-box/kelch-repeat protein At3g23880-like n=1 Tax=Helianthus annuus TaxID=4232 RepID=UPI001652D43C|nr:F-box/kelch-repeat protein At3g23880-like [Helianthus annuus]